MIWRRKSVYFIVSALNGRTVLFGFIRLFVVCFKILQNLLHILHYQMFYDLEFVTFRHQGLSVFRLLHSGSNVELSQRSVSRPSSCCYLGLPEELNSSISTLKSLWFYRSQTSYALIFVPSRRIFLSGSLDTSQGELISGLTPSHVFTSFWWVLIPFLMDLSNLRFHGTRARPTLITDKDGRWDLLHAVVIVFPVVPYLTSPTNMSRMWNELHS